MNIQRSQPSIPIASLLNPAPTVEQDQQNGNHTGESQQAAHSPLQARTGQPATLQHVLRDRQQIVRREHAELHQKASQFASQARGRALYYQLSKSHIAALQMRRAISLAQGTAFFNQLSDSHHLLSASNQMQSAESLAQGTVFFNQLSDSHHLLNASNQMRRAESLVQGNAMINRLSESQELLAFDTSLSHNDDQ
jgi:hypothetical protein